MPTTRLRYSRTSRLQFPMEQLSSWRVAAVLAVLLAAAAPLASVEQAASTAHRVEIRQFKFIPETLDVAPGDTITWVNLDFVPHTVTALDGNWDSAIMDPNAEWTTTVSPSMSGDYFCKYHPSMMGMFGISIPLTSNAMTKSDQDPRNGSTSLTKRLTSPSPHAPLPAER